MIKPHEYLSIFSAVKIYERFVPQESALAAPRNIGDINLDLDTFLRRETHYQLAREGWEWNRDGFKKEGRSLSPAEYNTTEISTVWAFERKLAENPQKELFASLREYFTHNTTK